MKTIVLPALAAALALAACSGSNNSTAAANDAAFADNSGDVVLNDEFGADNLTTATDNTLDATGDALGNTGDAIGNAADNAGDAADNAF